MEQLFELYAPRYGIETPAAIDLRTHLVLQWTRAAVHELREKHIYSNQATATVTANDGQSTD